MRSRATFARACADDARVEGARRRDDDDSFALRLACAHRFARITRVRAPRGATCASRSRARRIIDAGVGDTRLPSPSSSAAWSRRSRVETRERAASLLRSIARD